MIEPISPTIRTQLIDAVNRHGLVGGSFHLDTLRYEIDLAKCSKAHDERHLVRGSLIRKITAKRYKELRRTWHALTKQ